MALARAVADELADGDIESVAVVEIASGRGRGRRSGAGSPTWASTSSSSSRRWPSRRPGRWPRSRRCPASRSSSGRSTRRASSMARSTTDRSRPRARRSARRCCPTCCPAPIARSSSSWPGGRIRPASGARPRGAPPGRDRARHRAQLASAGSAARSTAMRTSMSTTTPCGPRPASSWCSSTRTRSSSDSGPSRTRMSGPRGRRAARLDVRGRAVAGRPRSLAPGGARPRGRRRRARPRWRRVQLPRPAVPVRRDDRDRAVLGARSADERRPAVHLHRRHRDRRRDADDQAARRGGRLPRDRGDRLRHRRGRHRQLRRARPRLAGAGARPRLRPNGWFCGKDAHCGVCAVFEPPAGPATLVGFTPASARSRRLSLRRRPRRADERDASRRPARSMARSDSPMGPVEDGVGALGERRRQPPQLGDAGRPVRGGRDRRDATSASTR